MPTLYLIEMNNPTLLSRAIKVFSRYPYNHLSIALDETLIPAYSFGRKHPNTPLVGGFVQEDYTHDFYQHSKVRLYTLEVSSDQWESLISHLNEFESNSDKWRYNFLGLVPAFLHQSWSRDHHFFCSQFVATLLKKAAILPAETCPDVLHPRDVIDLTHPVLVYEGALWNIPVVAKRRHTAEHQIPTGFSSIRYHLSIIKKEKIK